MSKEVKNVKKMENNQVVLKNQFTQDDIPSMLKTVTAKIAKLKAGVPVEDQTTGELEGFGRIKDIKSVSQLIKAHSSVINRAKAYAESAKLVVPEGVKTPVFKINGSTESQWVSDIKKRVVEVAFVNELVKLNKIKTKLEENLSAKDKLARDLADIQDILVD